MPVATAMMTVGFVGIYAINPRGALATLAGESFSIATIYSLTILPLFILMGNFAGISGMSRDLYDAAHAWVGHWRGGLASSTIVGCAGFSALSGSSLASAVTMGRVALPEMQRYGYDNKLATGAIAAGDTLGILINDDDTVGEYSTSDPIGIRSAPYTGYPRHYEDMGGSIIHFDGEIYAATIWRLWELFQANSVSQDTLYD